MFLQGSQCQIEPEDIALAREALEVLTIAIMLFPSALDSLTKDRQWQLFINDMILICRSRYDSGSRFARLSYLRLISICFM